MIELRPATERGMANWAQLGRAQQHACTAWLAERVGRTLSQQLGKSVTGVGSGVRERGLDEQHEFVLEEPVLIVRVRRKAKKPGRPAPRFIQCKMPVGDGKYRVVAVPTDVRVAGPRPLAQVAAHAVNMQGSISQRTLRGSLAVLVENTATDRNTLYALTCHHVAYLSIYDASLIGEQYSPASHSGANPVIPMGHSTRGATMQPAPGYSVDAALVRLQRGSYAANSQFWPYQPVVHAQSLGDVMQRAEAGAYICNARSGGAPVTVHGAVLDEHVSYAGGGVAKFKLLLQYSYQGSGDLPQGGDSGGALLDTHGGFLGMHIAGVGDTGYALPSYRLLRSTSFQPTLKLARPE